MPRLRVLTYNVQGFRAGVRAVATAVADEEPDVMLLNEVRSRRRVRRFAGLVGMEAVSGARWMRGVPNAVLVRRPWRVVRHETVRLTRTRRLARRGLVVAAIGRAGHRITAIAVHLGLSDRERVQHAAELTDLVAGAPGAAIVGGDLNEGPDGRAVRWIADRLWDAFSVAGEGEGLTFPTAAPRARIDYVLVTGEVRVERAWVPSGPDLASASDHLPVMAEVSFEE